MVYEIDGREDGYYGVLNKVREDKKVLIVLGGSEGDFRLTREIAKKFSDFGINTLATAYFNYPGLAKDYREIPLELVSRAVDRLEDYGYTTFYLYGFSMGAELALSAAAREPRIKKVIAVSPTDVNSPGFCWRTDKIRTYPTSAFSYNGKALAYEPFKLNLLRVLLSSLVKRSLDLRSIFPVGVPIPVEDLSADLLLISSRKDTLWDSKAASERIVKRLKKTGFRHKVVHRSFDASHFLIPAFIPQMLWFSSERKNASAGNKERVKAFKACIEFLNENDTNGRKKETTDQPAQPY